MALRCFVLRIDRNSHENTHPRRAHVITFGVRVNVLGHATSHRVVRARGPFASVCRGAMAAQRLILGGTLWHSLPAALGAVRGSCQARVRPKASSIATSTLARQPQGRGRPPTPITAACTHRESASADTGRVHGSEMASGTRAARTPCSYSNAASNNCTSTVEGVRMSPVSQPDGSNRLASDKFALFARFAKGVQRRALYLAGLSDSVRETMRWITFNQIHDHPSLPRLGYSSCWRGAAGREQPQKSPPCAPQHETLC